MVFALDFYSELKKRIPEQVKNYFEMLKINKSVQDIPFENHVVVTISSFFRDVSESRLNDHITKTQTAQRKKKRDWHKKFMQYIEYSYEDSYNPLNNEYQIIKNMNAAEYVKKYKDMSLEDILQQKKYDLIESVDAWLKNDDYFSDFPALSIHTDRTKVNILKDDIIKVACNYIHKELKYNFMQNMKSLPTTIVDKPIFSLSGSKIDLEEIDGVLQKIIKYGPEGDSFSLVPVNPDENLTHLTNRDREVFKNLTQIALSNGIDENGLRKTLVNLYNLSSQIYGYAVNSRDIEVIKNSIKRLANIRYVYSNGKTRVNYVLIDSIEWNVDDPNNIVVYFGRIPSIAIKNKDIISISKKDEEKIESQYGDHFIYALQGVRFTLYRDVPNNMTAEMTLDFFENCALINQKSFKKKTAIVLECLEDYKNNKIIISDYSYDYENEIFHLEFLPFSEEDMKYYVDWLVNHPRENQDEQQENS